MQFWLDICGRNGIIQNPKKFILGADTVEFAGFEITPDSVRPCKRYLQAIADFPTPCNITDIRSWFGPINQVTYTFSMTDMMLPFHELLKPNKNFYWDDHLQDLFDTLKLCIVQEIKNGVRIFNKNKPACLATNWSKVGIGFWLFQKHCRCTLDKPFCCRTGWKIIVALRIRPNHAILPSQERHSPLLMLLTKQDTLYLDVRNYSSLSIISPSLQYLVTDH